MEWCFDAFLYHLRENVAVNRHSANRQNKFVESIRKCAVGPLTTEIMVSRGGILFKSMDLV